MKVKILFPFLFLFSLNVSLNAQINDSLKTIINDPTISDSIKITTFYYIASKIVYQNPDSAEFYVKTALKISENINYESGIGEGYGWMGYLNAEKGNISVAIDYNLKSLHLAEKKELISDYPVILNNLATLYMDLEDNQEALKYYKKCIKLNTKLNKKKSLITNYSNISLIYNKLSNPKNALKFANKSVKLSEQLNDERLMSNAYSRLGSLYEQLDSINLALSFYQKSYDLRVKNNIKKGIAMISIKLSHIYIKQNHFKIAKKLANQAYDIANTWDYKYIKQESSKLLYQINKKENKNKQALFYFETYTQLKDSLNSKTNKEALIRSKFEFEYNKKQLVDSLEKEKILISNQVLIKEISINEEKLMKQKMWLVFSLLFIILLFAILLLIRKNNAVKMEKLRSEIKLRLTETKQLKNEIANSKISTPNHVNEVLKEKLTERENEILELLIRGLSNKEIADELFLSVNTIKTHILSLYNKLGVNNRTQAAVKGSLYHHK
jgi:DNA-binding CsgD family transcriptional regulator